MLGLLLVPVRPALADPEYSGPILYGIDPVLRTTRDPRLLGIERLVLRERLLDQGVDPDLGGGAALISAVGLDRPRAVEMLIARGADINVGDGQGRTAADIATANGHFEIAEYLRSLETRADRG